MSNSLSTVGRLTRDSELKDLGSVKVLEFSLASDQGFGDKKITNFFNCKLFGKRGESMAQYLLKGKQVFVIGELALRPYEGKNGKSISVDLNLSAVDFVQGATEAKPENVRQAPTSEEDTESLPF